MNKLDSDSLRAIQPSEINAYIKSKGWSRAEIEADRAAIWTKIINNNEFDLTIPLKQSFKDYHFRIENILKTLVTIEERDYLKILYDIKHSTSDVIRVRIMHPSTDDGELPFEGSSKLIEGTREIISAAICSMEDKKAFYSRKTNTALEFLKKLRTAQTEKGSFILKVVSHVPPRQQLSLFPNQLIDEPFERRFSLNLYDSLMACETASLTSIIDNNTDAFTSSVNKGVNANILDGIASLGTIFEANDLEFSISWAATRDIPEMYNRPVRIARDYIPFIQEASRYLKETAPLEDYTIVGYVEKLERPPGSSHGKIVVISQVEGTYKKIKISLPDQLYNIAVEAHQAPPNLISCTGELTKEGRSYTLENPRSFRIVELSE